MKAKQYTMNVLNGSALGVVVALVPGAIFSELLRALSGFWPGLLFAVQLLTATNSLIGLTVGVAVAAMFKFNAIEMLSVGIATMLSGGAISFTEAGMTLRGTGDIITMTFAAALAVGVILLVKPWAKGYEVLIVPSVSVLISAVIGRLSLPYFTAVTSAIGEGVKSLLSLEQTLMSVLIAIIFAFLIVSPISSVAIALAISISGVGAGAANLGVCATMFALAIACRRANPLGICLTHVIGSPKISMANVLKKPLLFVPIACSAAILGVLASLFSVQGTPMSAGFGISGLVGPLAHLNAVGYSLENLIITGLLFIVAPALLGFVVDHIFVDRLQLIHGDDYKIQL